LVIGNLASLREAIHPTANFNIDMTIVDNGVEIVVLHDVRRKDCNWDAHVGIVGGLHGGAQVEIFEVTHHVFGTGGGHNAVEEELCGDDVCGLGADIAQIFDSIPPTIHWTQCGTVFQGNEHR